MLRGRILFAPLTGLLASLTITGAAQQGRQLTSADYARAERFMNYNVNPLVLHSVEHPVWMDDGRFWYRDHDAEGTTFILVDPSKGTKAPAFDHAKLASALNAVHAGGTGQQAALSPHHLPISEFSLANHDLTVDVTIAEKHWSCDLSAAGVCHKDAQHDLPEGHAPVVLSPDGNKAVFIHDWNLWMRDIATGKETQLTTDGVQDFGYATDNAGWKHTDSPIVLWSPDSKKVATLSR